METFLLYILKSAALASIFILAYLILLRNDTSFSLNRKFLLAGIITSIILPAVEFSRKVSVESSPFPFYYNTTESLTAVSTPTPTFDLWEIAGIIYFLGLSYFIIRFFIQLFSLFKFIRNLELFKNNNFTYLTSEEKIKPFSFFRYICYNPKLHSAEDLKMILAHEEVHARQYHSVDVLAIHLFCFLLWFNPLIWIYKKHLLQNLEFLGDKEAIAASTSTEKYQKTLLKVSIANFQPALSNQFYQSFIKKRIMMLNKENRNPKIWKTSLVLPFILIFMFFFNIKTEAQISFVNQQKNEISDKKEDHKKSSSEDIIAIESENENAQIILQSTEPLYVIEGEIQKEGFNVKSIAVEHIKGINVLKGKSAIKKYGEKGKNGVVEIDLKSEQELLKEDGQQVEKEFSFTAEKIKFEDSVNSSSVKITAIHTAEFESTEALYVLNGKVQGEDFNIEGIDAENIKSINVLKGKVAIEKYGNKAKKGVIEITTKN